MSKETENAGWFNRAERVFANQVKRLREEHGWSQGDLALRMTREGLDYASQSTVSRIEKSLRPVRLVEAQAISRIFNRTLAELTEDDPATWLLAAMRSNELAVVRAIAHYKRAAREVKAAQRSAEAMLEVLDEQFPADKEIDPEVVALLAEMRASLSRSVGFDLVAEAATPGEQYEPQQWVRFGDREEVSDDGEHQAEA